MIKFKKIYIEITNVCNLNCKFCPKTKRKSKFISIDLFKKILNEVKNHTNYLYFHVMGEPLLHPDINIFLDLCHEFGYKVNITTNGINIDKIKEKILLKPALRLINFSLQSFDANIVNIDTYLNDIFNFIIQAKKNRDFIACLRLWNKDKPEYIRNNQYILKKIEKFFNVSFQIDESQCNVYGIKLTDNIYLSQDSIFEWPDKNIPDIDSKGFCYGMRNQAAILADGTVVPCCLDSEGTINLGNINESSFSSIIEGKRAMTLYENFSKRNVIEPLCKKCGYRKRFNLK